MYKLFLLICIFYTNNLWGQDIRKSISSNDSYFNDLYVFLEIAINQLELDKKVELNIQPDTSHYDGIKTDNEFLTQFLIDSAYIIESQNFHNSVINDSLQEYQFLARNISNHDSRKCLTKEDINEILQIKQANVSFEWEKSKLGFNSESNNEWYSFSVPIFNKNKTVAIIKITYTCTPFVCGSGDIFLFKKDSVGWRHYSLRHWDN